MNDEAEAPEVATDDQGQLAPTTVSGLNVSVKGFDNEDAARQLGQFVGEIVIELGRSLDLTTLDGVTIGVDYDAALASVDRGMSGLRPLSRSDTTEMQGVAMSPAVMRDGVVKTHLVFSAERLVPLIWQGPEVTDDDRAVSVGIIAHECAHVQVTAEKERAIPACRFGTPIEGYEHAVMFQIAEVCWDEYAVCRLSAPFASMQNDTHAATVIACAEVAGDQTDAAIRSYRLHGDLDRLLGEAGPPLCSPLKAVAYLLGGLDGDGADWSSQAAARTAIDDAGYGDIVDELHAELRRLWDTRGSWTPTLDTFALLEAIAKSTFDANGIFFHTNADGDCRIDVPFTPGTMPI
mgnify:CR=1 FL=1